MRDIPIVEIRGQQLNEMGFWLDQNMPNPPLPEPQRWTLGNGEDDRWGIRFYNDEDATAFILVWK